MTPRARHTLALLGVSHWVDRRAYSLGRTQAAEQPQPTQVPGTTATRPPQTTGHARSEPNAKVTQRSAPAQSGSAAARAALSDMADLMGSSDKSQGTVTRSPSSRPATPMATNAPSANSLDVAHPEVVCLGNGSALLFAAPAFVSGHSRLAKDLLAAASGNWQQQVEQLRFRWSELAAAGLQAQVAESSLLAFAEQRIDVSNARIVLCSHQLQPVLAKLVLAPGAQLLALPDLAQLSQDAEAKQRLWLSLSSAINS